MGGSFSVWAPPCGALSPTCAIFRQRTWFVTFFFLSWCDCRFFDVGFFVSHSRQVSHTSCKKARPPVGRPTVPPSSWMLKTFAPATRDRKAILFFVEGTLLPGSSDLRHLSSSGLRRLLSFFIYYLAFCAPDRGVSAWKVWAGRSVSSPWPESVASFFGAMLFGFGACHGRRQHHAGVVIPAPRACK